MITVITRFLLGLVLLKFNALALGLSLGEFLKSADIPSKMPFEPRIGIFQKIKHSVFQGCRVTDVSFVEQVPSDDKNVLKMRQFLNAENQVFAIQWNGYVMPDLIAILGDYFLEYREAFQKPYELPVLNKRYGEWETEHLKMWAFSVHIQYKGVVLLKDAVPRGFDVRQLF